MAKKPILVIMAAGMGSRYGGLKQIDPVGPSGEAILDYSLYDARRAGFETVVFIIKHEIEQPFKEAVVDLLKAKDEPTYLASWKFFFFGSWLNVLLVFIPLSVSMLPLRIVIDD